MRPGTLLLRTACLAAMAVWLGGFTFYAGVVVPILHDEFGSLMGSAVTRRATDALNLIGLASIALWWAWAIAGRRLGPRGWRRARVVLLGASTAGLAALCVMHTVMDHRLDTVGLDGFYPWHRAYLIVSTVQWATNLGLIAVGVRLMGDRAGDGRAIGAAGRDEDRALVAALGERSRGSGPVPDAESSVDE